MTNIDLHPLVPVQPFRLWLAMRVQKERGDQARVCRRLGIDPAIGCRILKGEQETIHVVVADRALTRAGHHLVELWPELYPECDFNLFGELYEVAA